MKIRSYIFIGLCLGWVGTSFSQVQDSLVEAVAPMILDTLPPATDTLAMVLDSAAVGIDTATSKFGQVDSAKNKKKFFIRRFFNDYPNPKKAVFLSLAVPGAGQFYNKRWWKTPFIYGGYFLFIRAIQNNTNKYHRYRDAYILELQGEPHEFSDTRLNAGDLKRIRDGFDKNRQLSIIGLVALHLIQTAEAFVDCHLKTFDVSDDLSMKVVPAFGSTAYGETTVGIGLRFQLSGP
ncbi:MAG: hypothetical protein H6577_02520 [Lewinellaceae bacterium]|nr:hypothetical protein [Saprospiraceae bacterium]MCB9336983.1 hypothetical protein [Lewinellaceae bacterium]